MMWLWSASAALVALSASLFLHRTTPMPIYGIYHRPKFFFIKYWIIRFILYLRGHRTRNKEIFGILRDMDRPLPLSDSPKAFDAVFFMATTPDGFYVVIGSERRKHNIINGLFYVKVPGLGLLCSHKLPDTVLFDAKEDFYEAEGLLIQSLQPLEKWRVSYMGEMWLHVNPTKQFQVKFNGIFTSNLPVFNFETDLNHDLVVSSIANEPWTVRYFKTFHKKHQSHYEQMGRMDAILIVGNDECILTNMASFRDHTFGNERDWDLMHRYVFHMIFLDDGTKAVVGVICKRTTCSILQVGYLYLPNGELLTMEWCDLKLYQHGESGKPPRDYAFRFRASGREFTVQVQVEYESEHFVGWRWESRILERFVRYKVEGVNGRGLSEWQYHSSRGRPLSASRQDPAWFSEAVAEYYSTV